MTKWVGNSTQMTQVFVISSRDSARREIINGDFYMSYHLPKSFLFSEPHFARLLWIQPHPKTPVYILPDFVEPQIVYGKSLPFLGCSGDGFEAFWAPILGNTIPSTGTIRFTAHSDTALKDNLNYTIIVEVASKIVD